MRPIIRSILLVTAAFAFANPVFASPADVVDASAGKSGETWTVSATIRHADTGWDHYADKFEVIAPNGTVLGTRMLAHPHVNEQPFTRSLSGLNIPEDVDRIFVRAGDNTGAPWGEIREILLKR